MRYQNYAKVLMYMYIDRFPIEAVMHDGSHILYRNRMEVLASSFGFRYENDTESLVVSDLRYPTDLRFYKGLSNGEVLSIFVGSDYTFLPVKDKIVIDIGANIGDSAIYFAMLGAKKVIALEPFPQNFEIAKRNIEMNHLNDQINLILGSFSSRGGHVTIIDNEEVGSGSYSEGHLTRGGYGSSVPLYTLEDLLRMGNSEKMVLKVDCEGCEYESLLSTSKEELAKLSHIEIEYHHGYTNLKKLLEKSGFDVRVRLPLFEARRITSKFVYIGYLYATNNHQIN